LKNSRQVIQCPKEKEQALIVEEQPTGNIMPERKKTQVIQCPKEKGQDLIIEEQPTGNTMPERKRTGLNH
jgi:hypothetical protein